MTDDRELHVPYEPYEAPVIQDRTPIDVPLIGGSVLPCAFFTPH